MAQAQAAKKTADNALTIANTANNKVVFANLANNVCFNTWKSSDGGAGFEIDVKCSNGSTLSLMATPNTWQFLENGKAIFIK